MQIVLRAEARRIGLKRYFTGDACIHGHIAPRTISNNACTECTRLKVRSYQHRNPEKTAAWMRAARAKYEQANPTKVRATKRAWKARNAEAVLEKHREYNERKRAQINQRNAAIKAARPWVRAENQRRRVFAQRKATPAWADRAAIVAVYKEAARLTHATGIRHTVDHVLPLMGKTVCGLHVHQNLQILTLSENARKGARL